MSDCSYRGSRDRDIADRDIADIAIWVFRESGPVVYGEGTGFFRPDRSIGSIGSTPARRSVGTPGSGARVDIFYPAGTRRVER